MSFPSAINRIAILALPSFMPTAKPLATFTCFSLMVMPSTTAPRSRASHSELPPSPQPASNTCSPDVMPVLSAKEAVGVEQRLVVGLGLSVPDAIMQRVRVAAP